MHFGEHLTIDGYDGDKAKLNSKELVLKCLDELPGLIGMRKLAKPEVYFAEGGGGKDPGGWSGFVVIAESHISIHTFPARKFISADVYSCKNGLDTKKITAYFKHTFALQEIDENFIKRGIHYPEHNIA